MVETRIIHSDTYGDYTAELIGIVDFTLYIKADKRERDIWFDNHHHLNTFLSCTYVRQFKTEDIDLDQMKIFVPTAKVNKNWDYTFWHNKYPDIKLNKTLPVQATRKLVDNWRKHSAVVMVKE